MKELKNLKAVVEGCNKLSGQYEDILTLIEMGYEENDASLIPDIRAELDEFVGEFEALRIDTLLSGEYDKNNAILKLNAGAGERKAATGAECFTGCIPGGRSAEDLMWKCWTIWMGMRRASSR